jgi:outer membrane immunogenic protein
VTSEIQCAIHADKISGVNFRATLRQEFSMRKALGAFVGGLSLVVMGPIAAHAQDFGYGYERPSNYNWSGLYFGGELGGFWSNIDGSLVTPPGHWDAGPAGGIGGGFIGFQKAFGSFVLGIEGGYVDTFNDSGSDSCHPSGCGGPGHIEGHIGEIWSVGPRLGYSTGKFMPYVTGGYANAEIENDLVSGGNTLASASDRFNGWYAGGGVDMSITGNWKIGVEYRHYEFEDENITPTGDDGAALRSTFSPTADTVTARLSYVFGGEREEPAPLK